MSCMYEAIAEILDEDRTNETILTHVLGMFKIYYESVVDTEIDESVISLWSSRKPEYATYIQDIFRHCPFICIHLLQSPADQELDGEDQLFAVKARGRTSNHWEDILDEMEEVETCVDCMDDLVGDYIDTGMQAGNESDARRVLADFLDFAREWDVSLGGYIFVSSKLYEAWLRQTEITEPGYAHVICWRFFIHLSPCVHYLTGESNVE